MISGLYDPQASQYEQYTHLSKYDRDEGLLVLPLAKVGGGDATDYKIITVHAAIGFRTVEWEAHKYATPPLMPSPTTTTPSGDIPLGSNLGAALPAIGSGQADYIFRAAGVYRYLQAAPRGPNNPTPLNTGWYPFSVPIIIAQLIGFFAGALGAATVQRAKSEADQENKAGANFIQHQTDLDFRYLSPNYSSQLFSSDLIR